MIKVIEIAIFACDEKDLPEGQTCMADDEIQKYYEGLKLFVGLINNFIDFDDIDRPVQSSIRQGIDIILNPSESHSFKAFFTRNRFVDNTNLV